jgi:SAM-dependent methyltransferase
MRIFVAPHAGESGKFLCVARAFAGAFEGRVLDVGSRTGNLARVMADGKSRYISLDIAAPADVIGDLDGGLPFADGAFDTAVALDVLEHTDGIHFAMRELMRVARRNLIVALPNAFELRGRLRVLRGRHVSGKYGLPVQPIRDRHRWFFGFTEARRFCEAATLSSGWVVKEQGALIGPRRRRLSSLVRRMPDLFAPTYLVWLRHPGSERATEAVSP